MFFLMNKDKKVASFEAKEGFLDTRYEIVNKYDDLQKTISGFSSDTNVSVPIGFKSIESWIEDRKASKHNEYLRKLMSFYGCDKTEGFIKITHAASLNDSFWVKDENENVNWKDINFYTNEYNETISKLAFEGLGLYGAQLSSTIPEMSTNGSFRKCWKRENGDIFLYKAGQTGARNVGLEPYCEVMASEISQKLCAGITYDLTKIHGEVASKCKLFTDEDTGYVPISRLGIDISNTDKILEFYERIGSEESFRRMLVLDGIIFNVDRHAGNYGVLVNNDTQEILTMAPVFDLNLALLPYVEKEEFSSIGDKLLEYGPRIGQDFTETAQKALTSSIRSDLVSLKGFRFSFRGDDKFPEERVKAIEGIINKQIEAILCNQLLQTKDVFIPKYQIENETETDHLNTKIDEKIIKNLIEKFMDSKAFDNCSIEEDGEKIHLILSIKNLDDTNVIVDPFENSIFVEQRGIELSYLDFSQQNPQIAEAYNIACRILDDYEFEPGHQNDQPMI